MTWTKHLPIKKKHKLSDSWMVRPDKETCEWINKKTEQHPGVSGNQIITAILKEAMIKESK